MGAARLRKLTSLALAGCHDAKEDLNAGGVAAGPQVVANALEFQITVEQ